MGYGAFLLANFALIAATVYVVDATFGLNGVVGIACIAYFLIAHYLFVKWRLYYASLASMSWSQIDDLLREWTRATFRYHTSHYAAVLRSGNRYEAVKAIRRLIAIHQELIQRLPDDAYGSRRRNELQRELESLNGFLASYNESASSAARTRSATTTDR